MTYIFVLRMYLQIAYFESRKFRTKRTIYRENDANQFMFVSPEI